MSRVGVNVNSSVKAMLKYTDVLAALGFVLMVAIIIVPITPGILDLLLTLNITFALIILLSTLFTADTRKMLIFPSILLTATLLRLALNISSTRLILSQGDAGKVVQAFGHFVVSGNYVVGLVIFIIITVVQFVVITNGAGRIAEVAARFALDALPGKQMSIDADFNAGLISEEQARLKRKELQNEADFYGAMDGASKFVRGDAIAGVVIVLINILGGLGVGMFQRGMDLAQATQVYTILTVGDGLVAQIPALLISTSAGMLVTRSTAEASFGEDVARQLFSFPKVLLITAGLLFALGSVPGLPGFPFYILGCACGLFSYGLVKENKRKAAREQDKGAEQARPEGSDELRYKVQVELMEIELGYNLLPLADDKAGGDLLERITAARRSAARDLGIYIQPIRVRDNLLLPPNEYVIKLKGNEVARGQIRPGLLLALNPGEQLPEGLEGIPARDPTFNLLAIWITEEFREQAEQAGCTIVDAATVLITHLTEIIKNNAYELLGRQAVKEMLDAVKETHPAVVEELVPEALTLGEIQKVMQNLLREKVPLHDLVTVLEELSDQARQTRDIDALTEAVRRSLRRTLTAQYRDSSGTIKVVTLDPSLEKMVADALQATPMGVIPLLDPEKMESIMQGIGQLCEKLAARGEEMVILVSPAIRLPFRRLLEKFHPQIPVLSINEILPEVRVEAVGVIKTDEA